MTVSCSATSVPPGPVESCGWAPRFMKIAHRGYSERYPENTGLAFERAVAAGADMIELDVHLSRDGQMVVIHDDTIDRTSDGRGRVADLTLDELKRHNFNNGMSLWGFVAVPTLEEVIDLVGNRLLLNIEIKKGPAGQERIEDRLIALLRRKASMDRIVVSSFDERILNEIKRLDRTVKTGLIYGADPVNFRRCVTELDVASVHPAIRAINAEQLRWARSRGLRVYPWVVKNRKMLRQCLVADFIDGVMVNDLELFSDI